MLEFVATIGIIILVLWLAYRASIAKKDGREIREVLNLHIIMYGLSCITGLCAFTFFLTVDIPKPIKIMASIIAGMILIFIANWMQKRGKKE